MDTQPLNGRDCGETMLKRSEVGPSCTRSTMSSSKSGSAVQSGMRFVDLNILIVYFPAGLDERLFETMKSSRMRKPTTHLSPMASNSETSLLHVPKSSCCCPFGHLLCITSRHTCYPWHPKAPRLRTLIRSSKASLCPKTSLIRWRTLKR